MSFFEIFQPGLRHLREEKDRLKSLVARPTHGGGAPLGIDLDTGTATFTMPRVEAGSQEAPTIEPEDGDQAPDRPGPVDPPADQRAAVEGPRRRLLGPAAATGAVARRARPEPDR